MFSVGEFNSLERPRAGVSGGLSESEVGAEVKEYMDEELGYPSRDKERFGLVGVPDARRLEMIEESDKHESRQELELVMPRDVMGLAHEEL